MVAHIYTWNFIYVQAADDAFLEASCKRYLTVASHFWQRDWFVSLHFSSLFMVPYPLSSYPPPLLMSCWLWTCGYRQFRSRHWHWHSGALWQSYNVAAGASPCSDGARIRRGPWARHSA